MVIIPPTRLNKNSRTRRARGDIVQIEKICENKSYADRTQVREVLSVATRMCHLSSAAEQLFCKEKVLGSNPRGGSKIYSGVSSLEEWPFPLPVRSLMPRTPCAARKSACSNLST